MVLHYSKDGSITMKLNIGGKTFNKIFILKLTIKNFYWVFDKIWKEK